MIEHLFCEDSLQLRQQLVILQGFARHVERQIGRIDDSVQEPQVVGKQVTAIVFNEDSLRTEIDPSCRART